MDSESNIIFIESPGKETVTGTNATSEREPPAKFVPRFPDKSTLSKPITLERYVKLKPYVPIGKKILFLTGEGSPLLVLFITFNVPNFVAYILFILHVVTLIFLFIVVYTIHSGHQIYYYKYNLKTKYKSTLTYGYNMPFYKMRFMFGMLNILLSIFLWIGMLLILTNNYFVLENSIPTMEVGGDIQYGYFISLSLINLFTSLSIRFILY